MKKQHKFLTVLLIIVLCVAMATCLIACDNNTETNQEEVKDTSEFITNGNFEVTTSDIFPKVPNGWTGSAGSTSSGNETDVDNKSLVSGVIDTNQKVYDKEKKAWNRLENPQAVGKDSNILMIYNKKDNSYKYTSNSFNLEPNKVFKIEVSVKTVNLTDESDGAYIKIGGDAFVEFKNINTKGNWVKYETLIKTSNISSNSLTVTLANGRGGKNDGMLSNGYAFFDNVVVSEVKDTENKTAYQQFDEFSTKLTATQNVDDLILGDYTFKNTSGDSNPYSARKWSGVTSEGSDGESAPTGSDYLERGIIDINNKGVPSIAENIKPFGKDGKMLMINNKQSTAYGYRTDNKIRFTASGEKTDVYYKLTVNVLTKNIEGKGAYIKLKSSTSKDDQIFILDSIKSEGAWSQVSLIIKPDKNRNKDVYLELGLGTGGKNDKDDLVKGQVFFDEISLTTATLDEYKQAEGENKAVNMESAISENLLSADDIYNKDNYVAGNYIDKDGITTRGEINVDKDAKTIKIVNNNPTVTRFMLSKPFEIKANNHYRLSIKVKTDILDKNKGIDVILYKKQKPNFENAGKDKELVKITEFNTLNVEKNQLADGSTEFVFLIQGDLKENANVYFEFVMGSGTNLTPSTLVKGSTTFSNIELNKINYTDYNSETGDYIKTYSFRSEDLTIANGEFNQADLSATKTNIEKISGDKNFDEADFLDKNSKGIFALPSNWTTATKDELENIYAGIFNINNEKQKELLGLTSVDFMQNMPAQIKNGNDNVLAISTKKSTGGSIKQPWGFTSPTLNITKGKYYEVSVWANLVEGSIATINLKSSSKSVLKTFELSANKGWKEYKFFINAGFDDFTAYLELKLGAKDNTESTTSGTVLFDTVNVIEIDEETYNHTEDITDDSMKNITFTTTSFDNYTKATDDQSLDTPNNWKGEHKDSDAPKDRYNSVAGVYNRLHGNRTWFGGKNEKDKAPISESELAKILNTTPKLDINNDKDVETIEGVDNNNVLVINNNVASEYTYSTTLADNSLTENKFYEISLYVLTYDVPKDKTATISLKLHNTTFEFAKNDARGINVNTNGKWVRYSFFVSTTDNADIDNVQLSVALGQAEEENYVSGYLFVDNVSITEISEARFDAKVPEKKFPGEKDKENDFKFDKAYSSTNHRIVFTADDLKKEEEKTEEKKTDPLLWLYITSGILGGLIVIVVIVVLLRKFHVFDKLTSKKSNNFNQKGSESYNRNRLNNKSNESNKDINKKHQD